MDNETVKKRSKFRSKALLKCPTRTAPELPALLTELCSPQTRKPVPCTGPPKTYRVDANSVLTRVRSFLPAMEEADKELKQLLRDDECEPKQRLDMELVKEGEPCIEMDVAVVPMAEGSLDNSSSSSSSSSSSEDEEETQEQKEPLNLPPLAKKKKRRTCCIKEL